MLPEDFEIGPLYLDNLKRAQHITEKAFSTHFSGRFGESYVDFGPARASAMSSVDDFVEIEVNEDFFYTIEPQGIRFGQEVGGDAFGLNGIEAIFTTGLSISMVPSSIAQPFFKRLLEGISSEDAYEENGVFYANCGAQFKDIYFMF